MEERRRLTNQLLHVILAHLAPKLEAPHSVPPLCGIINVLPTPPLVLLFSLPSVNARPKSRSANTGAVVQQ